MNILKLSAKAQEFYEGTRSRTLVSGYEKNVLVREDAENCLFVDASYKPQPGDVIFRCQTTNLQTSINLKYYSEPVDLAEIALKGRFTEPDWKEILDKTNGIMHVQELDPRDEISAELNSELADKVTQLTKVEGYILLLEIQNFWNNHFSFTRFYEKYK